VNDNNFQTVEINGVKLEVDMRTARKIENYRVGDRVKVLVKDYSTYKPYPGVIVAFDLFDAMPTITIAYLDTSYSGTDIKFAYLNGKEDNATEIAPYNDDIQVDKATVLDKLEGEINKKRAEIEDLESKKAYFNKNFQKYFSDYELIEGAN
jgi:hypothetical protein